MADLCPHVVTRGTGPSGTCRSELAPDMHPSQAGPKVTGAVTGPPWRRQSSSQSLGTPRPRVYTHIPQAILPFPFVLNQRGYFGNFCKQTKPWLAFERI